MGERVANRYIRHPEFDIQFITETGKYNIKYDSKIKSKPSDDLMGESVISLTTKNAMEDDSAVFSFVLTGDIYWDKVLSANDAVILSINPNSGKETPDLNTNILVGLVSEVRLEADYGENSKMYRISGQSFAKALIDFEVGVIQEVSVVLTEIGWLPDDEETGISFTHQNASAIAEAMIAKFMPLTKYSFEGGRTVDDFLEYSDLDSWTEYESLTEPSHFINYEGSLKQLLDDIAEKPFNETFFDFTSEGTCKLIMRRTPFDEDEWNSLPAHEITSKAVISESVAKSDTEVASIFNVIPENILGVDSVDLGSFPRYYQELVDKYGYTKLELKNKYLMSVHDATSDEFGESSSDSPDGEKITMEATAYSRNESGMSNITRDGTDLRDNPKVVAVDPSTIPLGSEVWIEGLGNYHVGDTGGDIKGNRIDIHMESVDECLKFGRKTIEVVVKKKGSKTKTADTSQEKTKKASTPDMVPQTKAKKPKRGLSSIYNITMSYLKAQPPQTLRVRKKVVSAKIQAVDSRITANKANALVDHYIKRKSLSIEQFSEITGITNETVEDVGDLSVTYSKLNKFLKDYKKKKIEDKELVRDAIMKEYKGITKDQATDIATTFLTNKGKISKDEYSKALKKTESQSSEDGPSAQEVNSEALKLFTMKIANWYCENGNFYSGEIKVVGSPRYRIGNRLWYTDEQNNEFWEYYIEGVQHDYSYSSGFITTLTVTRGLQAGGMDRFANLWGKSKEFKGGLLGEKSLEELYEEGKEAQGHIGGGSTSGSGDYPPASSKQLERAISWFRAREGKVRYSMGDNGPRTGPDSYDCSASIFASLIYGGILPEGTWLGSTETLFGMEGGLLQRISRKEVSRGDIFVAGTSGSSGGADGHTGMFLSNDRIIHCNYGAGTISDTPAEGGYMGDPRLEVSFFRIKGAK